MDPPLVYTEPTELIPGNSISSPSEIPSETLPPENQLPVSQDQSSETREAPIVIVNPAVTNPRKKKTSYYHHSQRRESTWNKTQKQTQPVDRKVSNWKICWNGTTGCWRTGNGRRGPQLSWIRKMDFSHGWRVSVTSEEQHLDNLQFTSREKCNQKQVGV